MICLDIKYLINALVAGTPEGAQITRWLKQGEPIALPSLASLS